MGLSGLAALSGISGVFVVMIFLQFVVHLSSALANSFTKKDQPSTQA